MSAGLRIWMPARVTLAHGVGGGMERHLDALARGLAGLGHEVTVVTTAHPAGTAEDLSDGVRTRYLPGSTWRRYQRGWWEASWRLLERSHARRPYAAILSESAGGLGYADAARRDLGLSTLAVLHGSARAELVAAWRGARTPRGAYRLGRAVFRTPPMLTRWRRARGAITRWVAVSPAVATANRREIGMPGERLSIIPNGVDTESFRPDPDARDRVGRRLSLPSDAPLVAIASRLEFEKGVQVALEATARLRARHPQARLVVAGRGRHEHALRKRARSLGLDGAALFLGRIEHAEVAELLAAAHACVVPTLHPEGLPLVAIEAQACGVPVLGSHGDGMAEAIADGVTGRLVKRGSADELARALDGLLADDGRRQAMGERGRERAVSRFSETTMVRATDALLREVAGST